MLPSWLRICVLDENGALVRDALCSSLGAHPPVIPTVDFGNGVPNTQADQPHGAALQRRCSRRSRNLSASSRRLPVDDADRIFALSGTRFAGGTLAAGASADLTFTATPTALGTLGRRGSIIDDRRSAPRLRRGAAGDRHHRHRDLRRAGDVQLSFGLQLIGDAARRSSPSRSPTAGMGDVSFASRPPSSPIQPTTTQFTIRVVAAQPDAGNYFASQRRHLVQRGRPTQPTAARERSRRRSNVHFSNGFGIYVAHVGLSGSAADDLLWNPDGADCRSPTSPPATRRSQSGIRSCRSIPTPRPSPVQPLDYVQFDGSVEPRPARTLPPTPGSCSASRPGSTTSLYRRSRGRRPRCRRWSPATMWFQLSVADLDRLHRHQPGHRARGAHRRHPHRAGLGRSRAATSICTTPAPAARCATPLIPLTTIPTPTGAARPQDCGHEEDPGGIYSRRYPQADDPTLDHDDQWGFPGPENVTQQIAVRSAARRSVSNLAPLLQRDPRRRRRQRPVRRGPPDRHRLPRRRAHQYLWLLPDGMTQDHQTWQCGKSLGRESRSPRSRRSAG